jgi:two-component system cell cycle sensor histidine kinase/response regulator CckA
MSPNPQPSLLRRRTLVTAILVIGTGLSLLSHRRAALNEEARLEADFIRRAEIRNALTESVINNFEARLFGLRHLFLGSDEVTREEFARVAGDIIKRYSGISALQWVPVVPAADRAVIEAKLTRESGRPVEFTRMESPGRLVRSPGADEHLPIVYTEPIAGNERALGYDLAFGPTVTELTRARTSGEIVVSRLIRLVQENTDERTGVIFIWPVYHTIDPEMQGFLGYVQGVFRVREILEESFKLQPGFAIDVLYLDPAETDPNQRVIHYRPGDTGPATTPTPTEADFRAGLHMKDSLKIGDRAWTVLYRPNAAWLRSQWQTYPLWRLLGGFVMTGLLADLIHAIGRRTEDIEQEVTERTAELSESRRQLESLLQALPGMAYRCTYPESGMQPLYFSAGALALTGYSAAELMAGQPQMRELIHPADLPLTRERTREALDKHQPFELEYRIRPRTGGEKWVLSRGAGFYNDAGKLLFYEGIVIDISTRKSAEAERLALERRLLEGRKLESLGLLAGGVAHDFNNLLTSIVGNAGLARLDLPAGSPADACLRQIETASQHAAELCQQMLTFAGKGRLTMESLDLNGLVEALMPLLKPSLNHKVQLDLQLAGSLPPVLVDASQLRQIVMNFVLNASDAIGDRAGQITLRTAHEVVTHQTLNECVVGTLLTEARYVVLEVRDSGSGMTRDVLARIFDPFFTTKFAGRGLGLAAVPGIVRGHGGALWVGSTPGQGTVFRLMLPPVK